MYINIPGGIDMLKTANTETAASARHMLLMEDRAKINLSGVREVSAFSDTAVSLKTECGELMIQGRGITISRLNTDTGEMYVNGEVSMLKYSKEKSKGSRLEGLFK